VVRVTTVPAADTRDRTFTIMLDDRQDLDNPRMLLADHGRSIGRVRGSPDGAYLKSTPWTASTAAATSGGWR
jgi:hypothetical protein